MLNYKEYIYAIYQERSFSKAAQKLYVSQPWLSSVVKKVEQEIKTPLFDRSTNPISLTPAGEYSWPLRRTCGSTLPPLPAPEPSCM